VHGVGSGGEGVAAHLSGSRAGPAEVLKIEAEV
jgi:hypothetical protein